MVSIGEIMSLYSFAPSKSIAFCNVRYERSKELSLIRNPNRPTPQYGKRQTFGSLYGVKYHILMSFLSDVAAKVDRRL